MPPAGGLVCFFHHAEERSSLPTGYSFHHPQLRAAAEDPHTSSGHHLNFSCRNQVGRAAQTAAVSHQYVSLALAVTTAILNMASNEPEPLGQGFFESWDSGFTGGRRSFQICIPHPNYSLFDYCNIARKNKETKWIRQLQGVCYQNGFLGLKRTTS